MTRERRQKIAKKLIISVILLLVSMPAFAQSVDTAWVRRYNGPGDSLDHGLAMAVDGSGNVYVTGASMGSASGDDYATIKYYPNGDTAWVRRYNGPGNNSDVAFGIALDGSGNVYVTGGSVGSGTDRDYATIKYDPDGDTAWVRRYNGEGDSHDVALAIAVDGAANVYVTGESFGGFGTDYDYATIKYYPNGDTAWVRRYDGPADSSDWAQDVEVDGSGNVYVTGWSYDNATNYDYATIKYYSNGDVAWVRRYNGPGDSTDYAQVMAVDSSGNAYVTGHSHGGVTSLDFATIKYYPNGDTAWVRRYNGPGNKWDWAFGIAVDGSGNVHVAGFSEGIGSDQDYATVKYNSDGDTAWVRRYNGPANKHDLAGALAVDDSGNVCVTGWSRTSLTEDDYITVKYYPNGDTAWLRSYNGPANGHDWGGPIAVDGSGNVYVTGCSYGNGTDGDYATLKYVQSTDVRDESGDQEKPAEFILSQNYPNPFNQSTRIEFTLPHSGFVSLNIYDVLGRKVRTLASQTLSSGYKSVFWDGRDNSGAEAASGVYFYRIELAYSGFDGAVDFTETRKLVLLK